MTEFFLNGRVTLHPGDCLDVLATLEENSIDSVVTDPPYHLTSIVKRFGAENAAPAKSGKTGAYKRASAGFMGKQWDGGDIAFRPELWSAVLRVLKPGGHILAFGGTRTYHRMACAIDDAGFEVRDAVLWHYGSGFPKSHDVSKGIDRAAGAEREPDDYVPNNLNAVYGGGMGGGVTTKRGAPATDSAREWQGWGTALKPATEIICLARKPLSEGTVAANCLKWGVGALNIDGCRVGADGGTSRGANGSNAGKPRNILHGGNFGIEKLDAGRWPANVLHDGSDEVVGAFPESGPAKSGGVAGWQKDGYVGGKYEPIERTGYDDNGGSAARFFYTAKADSDDRLGSKHPTVKPLDLIEYLEVLVTPPGGTVLDPFAGTGTAGEAAFRRGFKAILIEREEEYCNDIRRRMALCMSGPDERARESIKARTKDKPVDHGPLFGAAMTVSPVEQL